MGRVHQKPLWAQAIAERRRQLYSSQHSAAQIAGIGRSTLAQIEAGYTNPANLAAPKLLGLLRALQWTPEEFAEATGIELPDLSSTGAKNPPILPAGYSMIPVVGAANGGKPVEYAVPIRKDLMRQNAIAFEVQGDSMNDGSADAIRDGDLVLVDTSLTDLVPGKVYLVELPGQGLMVKRLRRVGDALWFMSDNPVNGSFPAEDVVRVVGQVYGKISYGRVS